MYAVFHIFQSHPAGRIGVFARLIAAPALMFDTPLV